MAGGMSAIIPAKRRKRSMLNLPTKPAIGTLGVGPKRAISTSPQKNIPAKIIPLKTHISLRVILLKIPLTPPPPESSLTFFTFLAGTAASGGCGGGAGSFGCDIFFFPYLSAAWGLGSRGTLRRILVLVSRLGGACRTRSPVLPGLLRLL